MEETWTVPDETEHIRPSRFPDLGISCYPKIPEISLSKNLEGLHPLIHNDFPDFNLIGKKYFNEVNTI